jgi:CBS domain-containing protein
VPALRLTDRRSAAAQQMHAAGTDAVLVTDGPRVLGIVTAVDLIRSLVPSGTA